MARTRATFGSCTTGASAACSAALETRVANNATYDFMRPSWQANRGRIPARNIPRGGLMARRLISSGSTFEKSIGYSRAVVDGDWVFVSGTTGFDYATMTISDDVVAQCEQALNNIAEALKQAGSGFRDVVRVHYLMTDAADFERCWPAMGRAFGEVRPSCT